MFKNQWDCSVTSTCESKVSMTIETAVSPVDKDNAYPAENIGYEVQNCSIGEDIYQALLRIVVVSPLSRRKSA